VGAMISAGVDPKETSAAPKSCSAASRRLIIANLLCCLCCLGQRMQSDYFTRRKFVTLLGGALVAWPLVARAQQARIWRIGLLETSSASAARRLLWEALRQRLRELGYLEGQNIAFELRFGDRKSDRLSASAAELVGLQVDVIVTSGTPAALAAKQATRTIPIIMAQLADPVGAGLVSSLRRPGGNIAGLTTQDPDLMENACNSSWRLSQEILTLATSLMRPIQALCSLPGAHKSQPNRWVCSFNTCPCAIRATWTTHSPL
jgi:ABC transporter substrate binding protein